LVLVEGPYLGVDPGRAAPLLLPQAPGCPYQQQLACCCCCRLHQAALLLLLLLLLLVLLLVKRLEVQLPQLQWAEQVLVLLPSADPQSQAVCHHNQQAVHLRGAQTMYIQRKVHTESVRKQQYRLSCWL
jgi:hypothetical protein